MVMVPCSPELLGGSLCTICTLAFFYTVSVLLLLLLFKLQLFYQATTENLNKEVWTTHLKSKLSSSDDEMEPKLEGVKGKWE